MAHPLPVYVGKRVLCLKKVHYELACFQNETHLKNEQKQLKIFKSEPNQKHTTKTKSIVRCKLLNKSQMNHLRFVEIC